MSNRGVSLTADQRRTLAALVRRHGAETVCGAAQVRSTQSLYRALSGATVLQMTAAALVAASERLAVPEASEPTEDPQ